MKNLIILLAIITLISCKKDKKTDPIICPVITESKDYTLKINHTVMYPEKPGLDTVYFSLKSDINTLYSFKGAPSSTPGVWVDASNISLPQIIHSGYKIKTGNKISWSFSYHNNSGNTSVNYILTELVLTEKKTGGKTELLKMNSPEAINFIGNTAKKDYTFTAP